MQILIGCAKTMRSSMPKELPFVTKPAFQHEADELAAQLAAYNPKELQDMLSVNNELSRETWLRYQNFFCPCGKVPAVLGYNGIVFQKLAPASMSAQDLEYANSHLLIGSFLYGLLRPLDIIKPYRLEGNVALPCTAHDSLFNFWKPRLTEWLIDTIKGDDGILVNLASNEFKDIFYWKQVEKAVKVVTPEFKVDKDGKLKTVVVYAKMCRGAMTRYILQNRLSSVDELRAFEYEGFAYQKDWLFTLPSLK